MSEGVAWVWPTKRSPNVCWDATSGTQSHDRMSGTGDRTLYPMLRPGSFVQIDSHQTKVLTDGWHDEFERPICFVELRDNLYVCSWCEVNGNQLVLLPSAQSGKQSRHVRYPGDADILGRVTAVTMRIAEMRGN